MSADFEYLGEWLEVNWRNGKAALDRIQARIAELEAEVERLRKAMAGRAARMEQLERRAHRAEAEVERLQGELDVLGDFQADLEDLARLRRIEEAARACMNLWYDGPLWPVPYEDEIAEVKVLRAALEEEA